MIGKFVVYESIFSDRMSFRQIVGETNHYWIVRNVKTLDESRVKKSTLGPSAFFAEADEACRVASQVTDRLLKARNDFIDSRNAIYCDLRIAGIGHSE